MKLLALLSLICLSLSSFAKVTVYFTSSSKVSFVKDILSAVVAENRFELKCQKMGEYCFDPQVGLYDPKDENKAIRVKESQDLEVSERKVRGLGAEGFFNTEMINCDKNNFYDVFCNRKSKRSKGQSSQATHEIWIDTSKVMGLYDSKKDDSSCKRSDFLNLLESSCVNANTFNLYSISNIKKKLGTLRQSCQSAKLNISIDKLIKWIRVNKALSLSIVLDEYYAQGKLMAFLKTRPNIKVKGIDEKIDLSQMTKPIANLKKYCM